MSNANLAETPTEARQAQWIRVCQLSDLVPDTGICALIHQQQIAIFYSRRLQEVFAVGNYDPIGQANVLSRGIIGSLGESTVVASPLYKQHFDLRTGLCLESSEHQLPVYPVQVKDGDILIQI